MKKHAKESKIFVVIPTYNEAGNLAEMVAALFDLRLPRLELVVVDDNSPDGTGQIADELCGLHSGHMHVIHRPGKQGLGTAYWQGFRFALEREADYIIQMDADFSHDPGIIPLMLDRIEGCDVVVGSRYVAGGQLDPDWSWQRNALSRWANQIYVRFVLGLKVQDATAGFKCWTRQALITLLGQPVGSSGYVFQVEMAYLTEQLGLTALEIPIYFRDRQIGNSKMSNAIKIEAAWRTLLLRRQYRHLLQSPRRPATQRRFAAQSPASAQRPSDLNPATVPARIANRSNRDN
jgi:dolichol-phosphate mannosyltransferase